MMDGLRLKDLLYYHSNCAAIYNNNILVQAVGKTNCHLSWFNNLALSTSLLIIFYLCTHNKIVIAFF